MKIQDVTVMLSLSLFGLLPFLVSSTPVLRDLGDYTVESIPGMPFLPTTYAGLLPISPGNDTEYFFWYIPTEGGSDDDLVFPIRCVLTR
jgi:hypothetical protein